MDPQYIAMLKARRSSGLRMMAFGALFLFGGLAVTGFSYVTASGSGGGSYFVAWGAVAIGALRLIMGAYRYLTNR